MARQAARQPATRERLIEAGLQLFAEQGFRETTVGQIERAAGLKPRRGSLYNHFRSKQELLEEAVRSRLPMMDRAADYLQHLPVGDVRAESLLLGRLMLAGLAEGEALMRIVDRDGDRLPEIRELVREKMSDAGYRTASDMARRWLGRRRDRVDTEALAVAMVGGLLNFHRARVTFGSPALDLADERFLAMWSRLCVVVTEAGIRGDLDTPNKTRKGTKATRPGR